MKYIKLIVVLLAASLAITSCKCHKDTPIVNVKVEFNPDDIWELTLMQGKAVKHLEGQKTIYIQLNPEAGTFNGSNGCNQYSGRFKDFANGEMILSDFNGSKTACPEQIHKAESDYMALLRRCNGYILGEYTLELTQNGKVLLTFEKTK